MSRFRLENRDRTAENYIIIYTNKKLSFTKRKVRQNISLLSFELFCVFFFVQIPFVNCVDIGFDTDVVTMADALAVDGTVAPCSVPAAVTSFCERLRENSANERVNGNGFLISCECKCR